MNINRKVTHRLLTTAACIMLAACQTTAPAPDKNSRSAKINSALERAAHSAAAKGERKQSFSYVEKIYKRNSNDPIAATNYAAALRESDYLDRAAIVLAPFANDPNTPSRTKSEYAAVQLALGNYEAAEKYAQKAVLQAPEDGRAYHYLGIALDAQGMHKEGERAFRKALDYWQGDPTSIMNNLALNLTSQNFLEEAIEILRKAKAVSPQKREIERNLRIITALYESQGGRAPKPMAKPVIEEKVSQQIEKNIQPSNTKAPITEVTVDEETSKKKTEPVEIQKSLNE